MSVSTSAADSGRAAASGIGRLLPGLAVLRGYQRSWLRGDLLAGVTVAAYLVPQVMAYAEVAGLPAVTGLWACLGPLLVYAVFGSSRQLSVGPESTTALMTAVGVAALVGAAGPQRHAEVAAMLALAVGVVCVIGWVARLGFLAGLLSKPVLIGYLAGIAVLMIVSQLGKVTGQRIPAGDPLQRLWYALTHPGHVHLLTLGLAASVLVALFALRRFAPTWPGPLIAMVAAAAVVRLLNLDVDLVGEVATGLPAIRVPDLASVDVLALFPAALGIAVVGFSDNVLTGRAFAAKHRENIDANSELLALGAANLAAGLSSGFPVSSSGSRTVLGDSMGARSQVYSLVVVAVVLGTLFVGGPLLAAFPTAALGAVVVYAAIRLVDVWEFRQLLGFRLTEFLLALTTAVAVVTLDVLIGIGVAIALSLLDLVHRISAPHDAILGYVPGEAGMHDIDDYPHTTRVPGLVVYRYDAPLFFANAENLRRRALAAVRHSPQPVYWFVLNAEANTQLDLTALDALSQLKSDLAEQGVEFALARVTFEVREQLRAAGFIDDVGADKIFATLPTAVQAYADWHEHRFGTRPSVPVLGPGLVWRPVDSHPVDSHPSQTPDQGAGPG